MQFLQERAHAGFANVFDNSGPMRAPWQLKLAVHIPGIQRIVGRAIGIGLRPEHIGSSKPKRATNRAWIVAGCSIAAGLALLTAKGGFPRPAGARNRNV